MASKTQTLMLLLLPFLLLSHFSSSHGCPIVTYWGQNGNEGELDEACDTGNYEIINIAFINKFGNGVTPTLDLTGHCNWITGVPNCTEYATQVAYCQSKGVEIFISLGGDSSGYTLTSEAEAKEVAEYLWNYYLSGQTSYTSPLGNVVLDGVDFDIEAGTNLYWDVLLKELDTYRKQRTFYLSAAPQCPIPDYYLNTAISTGLFDYIWVQFYNNPSCEYTDDGDTQKLISSWNQWTTSFEATKFYVGLPASPAANGSAGGYIPIDVLNNEIIPQVETSSKFGGIMLWSRYYDNLTHYSDKIICNATSASLVAMMESASKVLYRLSQF